MIVNLSNKVSRNLQRGTLFLPKSYYVLTMKPCTVPQMFYEYKLFSVETGKKDLICVTPAAVAQFKHISNSEGTKIIRIYTKKGGCAGDSYQIDYVSKPEKFDEIVEVSGVRIVIDGKALFKIIGCEIDYIQTPVKSEFIFRNPNAKEVCGCGQSFKV